jgi:hypothetical protein
LHWLLRWHVLQRMLHAKSEIAQYNEKWSNSLPPRCRPGRHVSWQQPAASS